MQKIKIVQFEKKSFTIKELNMRAVWDLVNSTQDGEGNFSDRFQQLLVMACPELGKEVLLDLYPSEIKELWDAFEEVNAAFLGVVRQVGLDRALIEAVTEVVKTSIAHFACSLPPATVQ
jgi:hypothetical protein